MRLGTTPARVRAAVLVTSLFSTSMSAVAWLPADAAGAAMVGSAAPSAGSLDPAFSDDGKQTTQFASRSSQGNDVVVQADGKVVVVGHTFVAGTSTGVEFAVARYNADGSLDPGFSGDGMVTTGFGGAAGDAARAMAAVVQPDGKLVVGGTFGLSSDFALARYHTDGTLDTTFSGDGRLTTDFVGPSSARDVALQPDGKIVMVGQAAVGGQWDLAVSRYLPDGSLDPSFSGDGLQTTDFAGANDNGLDVEIQPDGAIVVAGYAGTSGQPDFAVARYLPDGDLDPAFSGDGLQTTDLSGTSDLGWGMALQPDGRILVAGQAGGDFGLARYRADGSLDPTFSADGTLTTDFAGSGDSATDVVVQADGRIVVAGAAYSPGAGTGGVVQDFALARYLADGSLDVEFAGDGRQTADLGGTRDSANSLALQQDGKIVAAGAAGDGSSANFAVARFTAATPPSCSDGIDNDADGRVDFPADPGCEAPADGDESDPPAPTTPAPPTTGTTPTTPVHPEPPARPCTLWGTPGDDRLVGTPGDDVICAGAGDDVVHGRGGDDVIYGGKGRDELHGQGGHDRIHGRDGKDVLEGGSGDDRLTGDGRADVLSGGTGDDTLSGRRGADHLLGGRGQDRLSGGRGADRLVGGPGRDWQRP